jgi:glycerol-3-phosphate dehydrogenase (NAD(P)+)
LALGRGRSMQDAQRGIHQVVEGILASQAVYAVSERLSVEMPICREVFRIMHEEKPVREAVQELMGREMRSETE